MQRNDRIIFGLTAVTLSISGLIGWKLFGPAPEPRSFSLRRAEIVSGEDRQEVQGANQPEPSTALRRTAIAISEGKALSAAAMDHARVRYYDPDTGQTWEVDHAGTNDQLVSPTKLPGFFETIWSPNRHEVISKFKIAGSTTYKYFDYTTKRSVSLGSRMSSLVFSPDGDQVAYFISSGGIGVVYLADPDGQNVKKIFTTRLGNASLAWPSHNILTLTTLDEQTWTSSLFTLTTDGALEKLIDGADGLESVWSRDGSRLAYSFFDENGNLMLRTRSTEDVEAPVQARASECVWSPSGDSLICAVSQTPISRAVVETNSKTPADFYEITITDNAKRLLFASGTQSAKASVGQILTSLSGDYIFFINRYDGKLYSLKK